MPRRKEAGTQRTTSPGRKGAAATSETFMVTTFRITPTQWDALRREAMQRALGGATGDRRPDASRIVREALDEWLAKQRR